MLFATGGSPESLAPLAYAVSFAEENEARLIVLRVLPECRPSEQWLHEKSAADAIHGLNRLLPIGDKLSHRPEAIVEFGYPAGQILEVAGKRNADLIVLGLRSTDHLGAATHLGTTVAHKVVAHAPCAVLTVRGLYRGER